MLEQLLYRPHEWSQAQSQSPCSNSGIKEGAEVEFVKNLDKGIRVIALGCKMAGPFLQPKSSRTFKAGSVWHLYISLDSNTHGSHRLEK